MLLLHLGKLADSQLLACLRLVRNDYHLAGDPKTSEALLAHPFGLPDDLSSPYTTRLIILKL